MTRGVYHEKEPHYPEGNFRGDFKVGEALIEYFGLAGDPVYDARIKKRLVFVGSTGLFLLQYTLKTWLARRNLKAS